MRENHHIGGFIGKKRFPHVTHPPSPPPHGGITILEECVRPPPLPHSTAALGGITILEDLGFENSKVVIPTRYYSPPLRHAGESPLWLWKM